MEWFEDEEFWRGLYPYMFSAERFGIAAAEVEQVLALAGPAPRRVLDLCCGPARHSVEFARRGFEVTGVDRSPFLLEKARERAAEAGVSIEFVLEDMRSFRRPAAFDLACSLLTSFGYFEREEEDLQVLRNIHESLNPGGVLVMDVMPKERLARIWQNALFSEFPDGTLLVMRPQVRAGWCRIRNDWMLLKDGRYRTYSFEHTAYSARELRERMEASGFAEVRLYGDLGGSPYGLDATRLVAVARKAAS